MEMYYIGDFNEIVPHPFSVVVHASGFYLAYLLHADIVTCAVVVFVSAHHRTLYETAGVSAHRRVEIWLPVNGWSLC